MQPDNQDLFSEAIAAIDKQLNVKDKKTLAYEMQQLCIEVAKAKEANARPPKKGQPRVSVAAAIARCGGCVRRWHNYLIKTLTTPVFAGHDVAREYVRAWQQETFGKSIASGSLDRYAVAEHNGGGRAKRDELDAAAVARAQEIFFEYSDKLTRS